MGYDFFIVLIEVFLPDLSQVAVLRMRQMRFALALVLGWWLAGQGLDHAHAGDSPLLLVLLTRALLGCVVACATVFMPQEAFERGLMEGLAALTASALAGVRGFFKIAAGDPSDLPTVALGGLLRLPHIFSPARLRAGSWSRRAWLSGAALGSQLRPPRFSI